MKILFVDPPRRSITGKYTPAMGYLYMASFLKRGGYKDIGILDAHALGLKWNQMASRIKEFSPDVVATGSISADIYLRMALLETVKEINPSIVTVIGGPHSSMVPEEVLRVAGNSIDYLIVGEGELSFLELIREIEADVKNPDVSVIKGVAYLQDDKFIYNGARQLIDNLDELPMPDYSLIPVQRYKAYEFPGNPHDSTGIAFSRGCFHRCRFCTEGLMWQFKQRSRSASLMAEELKLLFHKYRKRNFIIGDTDFLFNKERSALFAEELEKSKIKISYNVMSTVKSIIRHKDLLPRLRKSGLVFIRVGVESYSQETLDSLSKSQRLQEIQEATSLLRKSKIPIINLFTIWGLENEPKNMRKIIIKHTHQLGGNLLTHSLITPLPGTEIYRDYKKKGLIDNWDYRNYTYFSPIVKNKYFSKRQLFFYQLANHFSWAYHPLRIFRNLFNRQKLHLQFVFYPRLSFTTLYKIFSGKGKKWIHEKERQFYQKHLSFHGVKEKIK